MKKKKVMQIIAWILFIFGLWSLFGKSVTPDFLINNFVGFLLLNFILQVIFFADYLFSKREKS